MSSITIRGIDALQRKLGKAAANDVLAKPMERSVNRIKRRMAEYPPPPQNSRYRRTFTLQRRWTTRVYKRPNGVQGKIGNNTRYAPWVQSSRFQARIHQGRWQTDKDVVDRLEPRIVADFQRSIDKALSE